MGFLDKAKAAAEQATAKAKEVGDDFQTKRDLDKAYDELGKATFDLIESGEVANVQLEEHAAKIRALREKAAGDDAPEEPAEAEPATAEPGTPEPETTEPVAATDPPV